MSTFAIEPDYQWKEAASQEGVDYDAVKKSFMDQAYGFVANKAKVLFQDPFRLGFEIVHRNEKATKMVGIFAFRCNNALLYAPVFFVNGEIKAADMLYRADVKRFVPLTDDWCSFLVRGANQEAGSMVDKSRSRQPDSNLDRLAYPQQVKYANEDGGALREILLHCASDDPEPRLLIPSLINDFGPDALTKLAEFIDNSDIAKRFVCDNYTAEQLTETTGWLAKQAAIEAENVELPAITVVIDPVMAKSAAERSDVMDYGYALVDSRPADLTNIVIEEIEDNAIYELASPCVADVMKGDGSTVKAILLQHVYGMLSGASDGVRAVPYYADGQRGIGVDIVYVPEGKELLTDFGTQTVFGTARTEDKELATIEASALSKGKTYVMINMDSMGCSDVFLVTGKSKDGDCTAIDFERNWGTRGKLFYSPGRDNCKGAYISDDSKFLEVSSDIEKSDSGAVNKINPKWTSVLMDGPGIDKWLRTAGGTTGSKDITITKSVTGLFDVKSKDHNGVIKTAHDLGRLAAHVKLAADWEMTCDAAGKMLDKTNDDRVVRFRLFDTMDKSAFSTRMQSMAPWIEGFDPELNVKTDTPQKQVLQTYTPQRSRQTPRYGDHYDRGKLSQRDPEEDGLPNDALMSKSPEELAQMASQYQMPHIFDHGALGQMATSMFNTVTQIQQYIPDLETGVDRYFRVLFLLRYRPADFEEAYGKDELMEMEQELSELANMSGENLLRMLKRFDLNKYSKQGA